MKYQILFSGENKTNITNLLSCVHKVKRLNGKYGRRISVVVFFFL